MKRSLLAVVSLLVVGSAWAQGVRPGHSGAWYNPDQSGHGLSVEVIAPDRAVAFWYAFDPAGNPFWLYIDGTIDGATVRGEAHYVDGMTWGVFDPAMRNMRSWGAVDIEFTGWAPARFRRRISRVSGGCNSRAHSTTSKSRTTEASGGP